MRVRRLFRSCVASVAAASIILSCGCGGRQWYTVGWFPLRAGAAGAPVADASAGEGLAAPHVVKHLAPESGVYKVKFATRADAEADDFHTYGGARRVVRQGDFLGFERGGDGRVYAIAGDDVFPLPPRRGGRSPAYLVWAFKPDIRPALEVAEGIGNVGRVVLVGMLVVGVVVLGIWVESLKGDDCACPER